MPAAEVFDALKARFDAGEFVLGAEVPVGALTDVLRELRDAHGYAFYITGSATDRPEEFEIVHGLRNLGSNDEFFVKTRVPKRLPELDSATAVFAGAEWFEREILDLFGVTFRSHPDPRRILMPDDYDGHPLRKDFAMDRPWGYRPTTGSEEA